MSPESVLLAALPSALVALLTIHVNRVRKDRDEKLDRLEKGAGQCAEEAQAAAVKFATLEAEVKALSNSDGDLKSQLAEIRENMARREDVTNLAASLGQRIDDALRSSRARKS